MVISKHFLEQENEQDTDVNCKTSTYKFIK